jgi:hypothetical protein
MKSIAFFAASGAADWASKKGLYYLSWGHPRVSTNPGSWRAGIKYFSGSEADVTPQSARLAQP